MAVTDCVTDSHGPVSADACFMLLTGIRNLEQYTRPSTPWARLSAEQPGENPLVDPRQRVEIGDIDVLVDFVD